MRSVTLQVCNALRHLQHDPQTSELATRNARSLLAPIQRIRKGKAQSGLEATLQVTVEALESLV